MQTIPTWANTETIGRGNVRKDTDDRMSSKSMDY